MVKEHWWNDTDRWKPKYSEKNLFQCHLFTPEILHELAEKQTEVCMVKGWKLTA
jgi:hypothetical protein